jgi:Domain of unknown function (DUF6434)/Benzoate membrane transport protein
VELVKALAGLALLGTIANAVHVAMANDQQREAALVTFLCAASGLTIGGIGSAFWGLVAGGLVMLISARRKRPWTMTGFDWHSDRITNATPVTGTYRNTQNVRRFLTQACGPEFKFDRALMAWIKDGHAKTMGYVAAEWMTRNPE